MNCFQFIVNIPNHQRFLQQERFKVGVKFKQFLTKGSELDGVNCDEVKRKIFDFAKTFIGGTSYLNVHCS